MATSTFTIGENFSRYITTLIAGHTLTLVLGKLTGAVSEMNVAVNRGAYAGAGAEAGELATAFGYTQGGIVVSAASSGTGGISGSTWRAFWSSGTVSLVLSGGAITIGGALIVDTSANTGVGSPGGVVVGTLDCANGGIGIVCANGTTFRLVPPTADETSGMLRVQPNG